MRNKTIKLKKKQYLIQQVIIYPYIASSNIVDVSIDIIYSNNKGLYIHFFVENNKTLFDYATGVVSKSSKYAGILGIQLTKTLQSVNDKLKKIKYEMLTADAILHAPSVTINVEYYGGILPSAFHQFIGILSVNKHQENVKKYILQLFG